MQEGYRRCMRCKGRKKMFKVGPIYSHTNTGGVEVDCPMCTGEGLIKDLKMIVDEGSTDKKIKKKKV